MRTAIACVREAVLGVLLVGPALVAAGANQSRSAVSPLGSLSIRLTNDTLVHALADCRQFIVVTSDSWAAVDAQICCFERERIEAPWQKAFPCSSAVVGRSGMGWGMGLHSDASDDAPRKKEGDGRAPAGMFGLNAVFGYAGATTAGVSQFPYTGLVDTTEGVDDPKSRYYNRIVDSGKTAKDWTSSEQMLRPDGLYKWGVVVEHNWNVPVPGAGSCIFLHIWSGPGQPTVGCTAAPADYIAQLVRWLNKTKHPLLIQLPKNEYEAVQSGLGLPKLEKPEQFDKRTSN